MAEPTDDWEDMPTPHQAAEAGDWEDLPVDAATAPSQAGMLELHAQNATTTAPRAAEVGRYADATKLDPQYVDKHLDQVKQHVDGQAVDWKGVATDHPEIASFLLKKPQRVAAAKDDLDNMGLLKWLFVAPARVLRDDAYRQAAAIRADAELFGLGSPENLAEAQALHQEYDFREYGAKAPLAKSYVALFKMAPQILGDIGARAVGGYLGGLIGGTAGEAAGAAAGAPEGGVGAAPGAVVGGVAGGVTGAGAGQLAASAIFNTLETAGPAYLSALDMRDANGAPLSPLAAKSLALGEGVATGALFAFLGPIGQRLPWGPKLIQKYGTGVISKALVTYGTKWLAATATMSAQSAISSAATKATEVASGQPFKGHALSDFVSGTLQGARDMALMPLAEGVAGHAMSRARQLKMMTDAAKASRFREVAPEEFEAFAREMKNQDGADRNVLVSLDAWDAYWADKGHDPAIVAAALMGDGGKGYAAAKAMKGDMPAPMEKWLTRVAPTEHAAPLLENARLGVDGLTPRQLALPEGAKAVSGEEPAPISQGQAPEATQPPAPESGTPPASAQLAARLSTELADPLARANEHYRDPISGLLDARAFDETPIPEGKAVAVITSPSIKGINDHPTAGGHDVANEALRAMGRTLFDVDPGAARGGTNFRILVDAANAETELQAALGKLKASLPAGMDVIGATGKDSEEAFASLRSRTEEGRAKAPEAEGHILPRGALRPELDVAGLKFPESTAAGEVPAHLVEKTAALSDKEFFERTYLDTVFLGPEGKREARPTGLLSMAGLRARPKQAHTLAIDLKGLGKLPREVGDRLLYTFARAASASGGSDFDATHRSGDEFSAQAGDPAQLEQYAQRIKSVLADKGIEYRDPATGETHVARIEFRHGIGADYATADRDLNARRRAEEAGAGGGTAAEVGAGAQPRGTTGSSSVERDRVAGAGGPEDRSADPGLQQADAIGRGSRPQAFPEEVAFNPEPPLFKAAIERMTPEQRTEYERAVREAREEAEAEVQRRLLEAKRRQNSDFMRAERERIAEQVEREFDGNRAYRALWFFQRGELKGVAELPPALTNEAGKPLRMDRQEIAERYGPDVADELPRGVAVKKGGVSPEFLAEQLGFSSGDEMIQSLRRIQPRADAVEQEAQRRLEAKFPSLLGSPMAAAEAAVDAIHSPKAMLKVILEARALARDLDPSRQARAAAMDPKRYREEARRIVSETQIGDLAPGRILQQERGAAARAIEAAAAGKLDRAFDEQDAQLLNMAVYREAKAASERAGANLAFLKKLTTADQRAKLAKVPGGYLEQVDRLLEGFEFRASQSEVGRRARTLEWIQQEQAAGRDPILPGYVVEALDRTTHWKDLTPAQLEDLRVAVENVTHLAKLKDTLLTERGRRDRAALLSELQASLLSSFEPQPARRVEETAPPLEKVSALKAKAKAVAIRPEELVRQMDGGAIDGPWSRALWNPVSDGYNRWQNLVKEVTAPIIETLQGLSLADRRRLVDTRFTVKGQTFTMEQAYAVALNMGNDSNAAKLIQGEQGVERHGLQSWDPSTPDEIVSHLTRKDWEAVQTIWDRLDSMWPLMAALEKRLTGVEPPRIQPRPFTRTLADGTTIGLKGGYYPIAFDPRYSKAGARTLEASSAQSFQLFQAGYYRALTPQGHLQARVENFARPLELSLHVLPKHISEAAKDIAMREALISVHDILTDEDTRAVMRRTIGDANLKVLDGWLRDSANDLVIPDGGAGLVLAAMNKARSGMAGAVFAYNAGQVLQNFATFSNAANAVGVEHLRQGLAKVAHDRMGAIRWVNSKSAEMANRAQSFDANIHQALRDLRGQSGKLARAKEVGMWGMQVTDAMVAYPTWIGAYEKALEAGRSDDVAVREADRAVRLGLYAGRPVDLPAIMRHPVTKWFTMFYGFADSQLNQLFAAHHDAQRLADDGFRYRAMRRVTKTYMYTMIGFILAELLTGKGPSDEDDDGEVTTTDSVDWAIHKALMAPVTLAPVLGSIAKGVESGRDVSMTPYMRAFDSTAQAARAAWRLKDGEEIDSDDLINAALQGATAYGYFKGLPVNQVRATGGYLNSLYQGDDEAQDVFDFGLGVGFGKKRKGKLNAALYPKL